MSDFFNPTPITRERLAEITGRSVEVVDAWFERACGGYDRYVEICKDPKGLELLLERLSKEAFSDE